MERAAFSRALRFLNYHPVAKWAALSAAVGTAVVYVALLIVLGLYVDLTVNRGEITAYQQLLPAEQEKFREAEFQATESQVADTLRDLGIRDAAQLKEFTQLCLVNPKKLNAREQDYRLELLWRIHVNRLLDERVGADAAEQYRKGFAKQVKNVGADEALFRDVTGLGVLSLVVRTEHRLDGHLISWLASWNPWMWCRATSPS